MLGEKVVEKLSKNDEKNISLVFWLEENLCKCSDKYYICISKGHRNCLWKREFHKLILSLVVFLLQQYKSQDVSGFTTKAKNGH